MSEMHHDRFEELKDAYVLGAVTEEERREFEGYLAAHPERQAEVDELGAVARLLAFSPREQEPPTELRSRVMDAVESEAGLPRRRRSGFAGIGRFFSGRNLALGAAAALLIALFSWNALLRGEVQDLRGQLESARAQAPQEQTIVLKGSWAQQGAQVEVTALDEDRVILVAENMPQVPEDRTLQIWVIQGDTPKPSGLFNPEGNMTATAITTSLEKADAIAVTIEPAGGSQEPTSDPVLVTEL